MLPPSRSDQSGASDVNADPQHTDQQNTDHLSDKLRDPAFLEKVAQRVYQLMIEDARHERERRGQ